MGERTESIAQWLVDGKTTESVVSVPRIYRFHSAGRRDDEHRTDAMGPVTRPDAGNPIVVRGSQRRVFVRSPKAPASLLDDLIGTMSGTKQMKMRVSKRFSPRRESVMVV